MLVFVLCAALCCGSRCALAQSCPVSSAPVYAHSTINDHFTSIFASGAGVASTIGIPGPDTSMSWFNMFGPMGINGPIGDSVTINFTRSTATYTAYLTLYVDMDNGGSFDPSELVGSMVEVFPGTVSGTYGFRIPGCATTGQPLHMRFMLSEVTGGVGAPCSANWGQAYDFHLIAMCSPAAPISGNLSVCYNDSSLLSSPTACNWGSGNPAVATVSQNGMVHGISAGTATISYSNSCGHASVVVTVTPLPITGLPGLCESETTTLTAGTPGGTWSSSDSSIVNFLLPPGTTALVLGGSVGSATVTYSVGGCFTTKHLTVDHIITITGAHATCLAAPDIMLTSSAVGGTWASSNSSIATVDATGRVHAVGTGLVNIIDTAASGGCFSSVGIMVYAAPTFSGPSQVCGDSTITLSTGMFGTWTSSDVSVATVASGGVVHGLAAGTAIITFTYAPDCFVTDIITVVHPSITGGGVSPGAVCTGATGNFYGSPPGGTWSSSNTSIAAIDPTGLATGVSAGTVTISYVKSGCPAIDAVTVYPTPTVGITSSVNCGTPVTLFANVLGGAWSSSDISKATAVFLGTGLFLGAPVSEGKVTAVAPGSATIIYTSSAGCIGTWAMTVIGPSISGASEICVGSSTTLSTSLPGGAWHSGSTIATIGPSSSVLHSVAAGTDPVTYTIGGCPAYWSVVIDPMPTISGATAACSGSTISMTPSLSGGTWSYSGSTISSIHAGPGSSEAVNVYGSGTSTIYYSLGTCTQVHNVTVSNPIISGPIYLCTGSTATFTAGTPGGTWSSLIPSIATINSTTGFVNALTAGSTALTYTVAGCTGTFGLPVHTMPTISGPDHYCASIFPLTASPSGGSWVGTATGGVSASLSTGYSVTVPTYSMAYNLSGCVATKAVTVLSEPNPNTAYFPECLASAGGCVKGPCLCWGPDHIGAAPDLYGVWSSSNIDLGIWSSPPYGGYSWVSVSPHLSYDWLGFAVWDPTSGWAKYSLIYTGYGSMSCSVSWEFHGP